MKTKLLSLIAIIVAQVMQAQVPTNNLIGSYYFNNGSPYSGASGTINLSPSVPTATSQVTDRNSTNNAIEFNNALFRSDLDFVQGTTNVNMHYSFWIKTNQSDANERTIIDDSGRSSANFSGSDRGYYIFIKQGRVHFKAQYRDGNGNFTPIEFSTITVINDNAWHHIAINISQTIVNSSYDFSGEFYVDNVLELGALNQSLTGGNVISFDRNGTVTLNNNKDRNLPASNRFNQQIDDLHIYNRTLTAAEISTIFNDTSNGNNGGTLNPTSQPLLFSYSFNPNANFINDVTLTTDLNQSGFNVTDVPDRDANANSAISVPSSSNLTRPNISITNSDESNTFSYSFWIKTSINDGNRRTIIDDSSRGTEGFSGNDRGYFFYLINGNVGSRVRFSAPTFTSNSIVSRGVESSNVNIADNNWHHVVFTINNRDKLNDPNTWRLTIDLYIDGTLNDTEEVDYIKEDNTPFPLPMDRNGSITINNNRVPNLNTNQVFMSSLDDLKAFSGVLTQSEVTALFNQATLSSNTLDLQSPEVRIYPNPVSNDLFFTERFEKISVYSILGKEVLKTTGSQIDVSSLKAGVYLLKLTNGNQSITKRFIKE